ncbi:hypothetical protein ACMD2_13813, partial [Ananas comosus]
ERFTSPPSASFLFPPSVASPLLYASFPLLRVPLSACSPSLSLSQVCPFHRHHFERLPPLLRRRRPHGASVEPPGRESLQHPCRLPRDPQPRRSNLHCHHLLLPPPRPKKLIGPRLYTDRGDLEQPCDFWQNPASFHEVFIVIVVIIFIIIPVFVHSFGSFSFGMAEIAHVVYCMK